MKERKEWNNRRLKHVKPKEEIRNHLLRFLDGQKSKLLLKKWIDVEPTVCWNTDQTKAKYEPSIKKHWLQVCSMVTMPGYWIEMGVREGRSVGWMLEEYRVSVFAQELGTAHPVSPKRLDKKLEQIERTP